jgi:hypothetical protein
MSMSHNRTNQGGAGQPVRASREEDVVLATAIDLRDATEPGTPMHALVRSLFEALGVPELMQRKGFESCAKDGCTRPTIPAREGYSGPLYCSPVHAFVDRANREVGAVR